MFHGSQRTGRKMPGARVAIPDAAPNNDVMPVLYTFNIAGRRGELREVYGPEYVWQRLGAPWFTYRGSLHVKGVTLDTFGSMKVHDLPLVHASSDQYTRWLSRTNAVTDKPGVLTIAPRPVVLALAGLNAEASRGRFTEARFIEQCTRRLNLPVLEYYGGELPITARGPFERFFSPEDRQTMEPFAVLSTEPSTGLIMIEGCQEGVYLTTLGSPARP